MILTADWVVPVAGEPIRNGAVVVKGSRIAAVGHIDRIVAAHPDDKPERFKDCAIIPGLVNAHSHLSLTVLRGLLPDLPLAEWLRAVTHALRSMSTDDFATSASLGAIDSLRCGVTCVGDIAYGPEALAACADIGLGGVFYWEVLGLDADDLSGELAEREFPSAEQPSVSGHVRCGISPHTAYTSGPDLLRATWLVAHKHGTGFAIHVAESAAERELMIEGTGPFAPTSRRLAHRFVTPRSGVVSYLDSLGVLEGAVAVHCVHLEAGDATVLKRRCAGVVMCPRSNARLGNGEPPVALLRAAGARVAVGTDSAASNDDLDLFAEGRAVRALDRTIGPDALLRMLTLHGAETLGMADTVGSLAPGLSADLTVVRIGQTEDPVATIVDTAGPDTIQDVVTQGLWRIRKGSMAFPVANVESDSERLRDSIRRSLAERTG